jgi:hypothetical protein
MVAPMSRTPLRDDGVWGSPLIENEDGIRAPTAAGKPYVMRRRARTMASVTSPAIT